MRISKPQARQMAEELLALKPMVERYRELEKALKQALPALDMTEVETAKGRVFISISERRFVDPALAQRTLGDALAEKVVQIKRSVSLKLLDAFVEVGDISPETYAELVETRQTVALHIRPLR